MSTSSNVSQSTYSASELETTQGTQTQSLIQNFDQSVNHVELGHSIEQSLKDAQKELHQKRIQSLRMELDYLKATEWEFEHDKGFVHNEEIDDEDKENFLSEELIDLEYLNQSEDAQDSVVDLKIDVPRNAVCIQRTGTISYIAENSTYALIDGILYFDLSACSVQVFVNDKVLYLAYKDKNESIVVVRILENQGQLWGVEEEIEDNYEVMNHFMVGEVDYRQERNVYIKDSDLKFCLDNVEGKFIPVKGDWLELHCTVQWDENKPSDISMSKVLEVLSFKPLRSKIKNAVITNSFGDSGSCDKHIYFDKQSLHNDTMPQVGAQVMVEAIESNQGAYCWRAIKMITITGSKLDTNNTITSSNEEDDSLKLETEKEISVTYPLQFTKINIYDTNTIELTITNNSNYTHVLNKWIVLSKKKDSQINIKPFVTRPIQMNSKEKLYFKITCTPKFLGNTRECFIILFKGFQIKRFIEISVIDDNISTYDIPENHKGDKLQTLKNIRKDRNKMILPGVKVCRPPNFIPVKLGDFSIPEKIWSVLLGDSKQAISSNNFNKIIDRIEHKFPCLLQDLSITNYTDQWHTLLFMEEIQANVSMREYDMFKVFLTRCQDYLCIEIDGLSERRPSLIKGDKVMVTDVWNSNAPRYEGFIHNIKGNLVMIKFNSQFHENYNGSDVSIEFHSNRTVYRKSHQAINLALNNLGVDILFPSRISLKAPSVAPDKLKDITWYNKNLNVQQKQAVYNILIAECRPMPYCIFGPPGTGKTITVVETILQVLTCLPSSRILVATPSNSAANLITERLVEYKKDFSLIRLLAFYLIDSDTIPDKIKPFCGTLDITKEDTAMSKYEKKKNGMNLNCGTSFIGRHRVTIGTCYCLGSLAQMGLPKGHFTHIIVDEAGQATEPEIMIPMTFTDKNNGQIILAGDPMQLGPIVMSKYCKHFDMDESYLSRLLNTYPYQRDYVAYENGFNNKLVTKLVDNYRSLIEVLKLPSEMFYSSSLVPKMDRNQMCIHKIIGVINDIFEITDTKDGGIFTYGIRGCNMRAEDSPSWYNPQEASMVTLTVCKLYKKNICADEIGIITPYVAQIKHLRTLFEAMGLPQPKIGTVEEFQGQERMIILISTVRSAESSLEDDIKHTLGFVRNPKRLNVALTRAQVAVILFCNPHLLCKDTLWKKVISYSVSQDKYMGCDLPFISD